MTFHSPENLEVSAWKLPGRTTVVSPLFGKFGQTFYMPFYSSFRPNGAEHKKVEQMFMQHYSSLYAQANNLIGDGQLAKDVIQEVFISILKEKIVLDTQTALSYLSRAVFLKCIRMLEKDRQHKDRLELISQYFDLEDNSNTYAEKDWQRRQAEMFSDIISMLPQQRQHALRLVYFEDLRYKEAASEMGITINSLKSHLRMALITLRGILSR